jgi:ABC-type transport system involved in Fe-S cluster assembly fused permease/ATPase subunit
VLQEGRIVESGTHADLLQQTGVYRHLTKSGAAGLH